MRKRFGIKVIPLILSQVTVVPATFFIKLWFRLRHVAETPNTVPNFLKLPYPDPKNCQINMIRPSDIIPTQMRQLT